MVILWLEADDREDAERLFSRRQVEVVQPSDGQFMMIADPDALMIEVWQSECPNELNPGTCGSWFLGHGTSDLELGHSDAE